ncbi:efflux RND transporter permease subunit [Mariniphaga sediminis]|uniref:Efflux RND transporter permease subunit n=1 Tax=Mariniphaga sediminis TaxID=1628158 RepID=A0A399CXH3_9BACT|nr:efflux RND transporter permease subunit [Mariniphaga sediminis]RIH63863.1 efflux RND transporter permease subunit [Mariniphaga sediminis]
MNIYKNAVNKPITTLMVFTAIVVMGIYSLVQIPVDLYPEMDPPYISIMTTYAGANASDIETNVTRTIEDALNSVDNLKEITSTSSDNLSVINLEFEWETDLAEATNDIRDVIDRVIDFLPEDAERPMIFKFNTSMMPIVFYAVTAEESYPGLEKLLDEKIINPMNRIEGIGSIGLMGAPRRVVYIDADPRLLEAYNLTIEQIGNTVAAENMNLPSGNIKMGKLDYQLRVQGEFSTSSRIENLVIGNMSGKPVYIRDVAVVRDSIKDLSLDEKINGETGLRMFVMKQSGANTVKVAREARKTVDELQESLPPDVEISLIMDTSDFIKGSVKNLSETLMWALLFVVLVVLFFLGRWRATFIIVLTIPISLIVAFLYLYVTGGSINVISLTSLSIAIGMVVDDAIVVLENITRHVERGATPREAAIYATNEVWLAVVITTLVVVAVFFPLTLVGGMTGVFFNQLGWIVTITVVTSTLAAISLTPMLSSRFLKLRERRKNPGPLSYDRTIEKFLGKLDDFYEKTLRWTLRHKLITLFAALAIFIGSMMLIQFVHTDFMPESDESRVTASIELQTGTRVEETIKTTRYLEKVINEKFPEVEVMAASSGADDEGGLFSLFMSTGSNMINFMMRLTPIEERERSVWDVAAALREEIAALPEVINFSVETAAQGMGGTTNTVDVEIYGYDFDMTNALAEEIRQKVAAVPGAINVQVSRKNDKPELQFVPDRDKMALHGLTTAQVSANIRNRVSGMIASQYKEEGEEYDIRVRLEEEYRNSITELEEFSIVTPSGKRIKLKELGEVKEYWSPPNIEHKRRERIVTVSAKPDRVALGELANRIKTEIADVKVPQELILNVGGAYEDQQESFLDLGLLMLISLILVFIVMASQFESFTMPFVIMFSIPFAFTGVVLALLITGTTLSLVAALGAVLLIGIVVKNGIVLIDFTNLMRDRGLDLYEAIAVSGKSRLRPVLMTAATTILGMLPLALSTGEGAELWRPMGITVIGGLTFSTLVTMIVVPVMYGLLAHHGERNKKGKVAKQFKFME